MSNRTKRKIDKFNLINVTILISLAITIIFPLYNTILISLSDEATANKNPLMLIPKTLYLGNYQAIFADPRIITSFANSIIVVVFGVIYNLFMTVTMAYGFAQKKFPGRSFLLNLVIFTMFFSGGLIPFYLLVRDIGLINNLAVLIIPTGLSTFNMIIVKNFFQQLPIELSEASRIDGAGELRILFQILLPISMPVLATFTLFYAVDRWNEWFNAMLFINDRAKYPIQLTLREIIGLASNTAAAQQAALAGQGPKSFAMGVKMASVVVVMGPIMILYPFLQKYFMKGMIVGAIKG